jgi:hypothetical protein
MKHVNLLFGISPYRDDGSDVDSENDNVQVRGLCYTVDNPAVEEDKDNSHDERCHCEECMIDGCQRYRCFLCERDNMRLEAAEYHCSEDTHMGNLQELKREQEDAICLVDRWNQIHAKKEFKRLGGADRFCLPDSLLAAVYRYTAAKSPDEESQHTILKAYRLMKAFEDAERLTLLWLAVWKAECLLQMPLSADFYATQKWFLSEWKNAKNAQRQSNAMSTITALVCPFLQSPNRT